MSAFVFLLIAIISEVFASSMLKLTSGFKRLLPSIGVVIGYGAAFYFLSLTLQSLPIGTAYAVWAGLGIIFYLFKRKEYVRISKEELDYYILGSTQTNDDASNNQPPPVNLDA